MSNQWGRSGNGRTASRGGAGGILFASLVCLAFGGAAGYGAFRLAGDAAPSGEIEQRDRRIADLAKELDARISEIDAGSRKAEALSKENENLKRRLESLRASGTTAAAQTTVSEADYARLTQEVVPELKNAFELSRQRVADAEALKARAEEAVRERERRLSISADRIGQLEAEADALRRQLAETRDAAEKVRTGDLPALRAEIARKDKEIAALTARIATLETAGRAARPSRPVEGAEKPAEGRNPRNAALVARAMQDTPGLEPLSDTQRDRLEQTLVSGECVTNALGGVFKRVPVLALRNLMRDLDSDC